MISKTLTLEMNEKVSPTRVVPVVLHKKVLRSVVEALDLHCEALPYDVLVTYKVKSKAGGVNTDYFTPPGPR